MLDEVAPLSATCVLYESPRRLAETLVDLQEAWGDRRACVARELTKLHEEFVRGPLSALVARYAGEETRGEVVVLDSGSKTLGADRAPWATGYGRILGEPDARITALSEHHATVQWPNAGTRPDLGQRVRVIPNHVCNAVNLADELIVVDGRHADAVMDRWRVAARGCTT